MPTQTYQEISKGVNQTWYAHRERIPKREEIRIHETLFDRIKEKIQRNGLKLDKKLATTNIYDTQVYSVFGAKILINQLMLPHFECECILHIQPKYYLTISTRSRENLEAIAEKLGLPLEEIVQ